MLRPMGERKRVGTRMSSVWPGFSELNEEQARLVLQCPVVMAEEVSKVGWVSEGSYEDFFYSSEGIDNTEISTKQRCVTDRAIQNQRALMITRDDMHDERARKGVLWNDRPALPKQPNSVFEKGLKAGVLAVRELNDRMNVEGLGPSGSDGVLD